MYIAIRLVIVLTKLITIERGLASRTREMLRMPTLIQGGHIWALDHLVTGAAEKIHTQAHRSMARRWKGEQCGPVCSEKCSH